MTNLVNRIDFIVCFIKLCYFIRCHLQHHKYKLNRFLGSLMISLLVFHVQHVRLFNADGEWRDPGTAVLSFRQSKG